MRMPVTIAEFLSGKQIAVPPRARAKVRIVAMVEAAGIEPASEDVSSGTLTCVAHRFKSRVAGLR